VNYLSDEGEIKHSTFMKRRGDKMKRETIHSSKWLVNLKLISLSHPPLGSHNIPSLISEW
jgi:hypothetical protein